MFMKIISFKINFTKAISLGKWIDDHLPKNDLYDVLKVFVRTMVYTYFVYYGYTVLV